LLFETGWYTPEDMTRTQQYQTLARMAAMEANTASIDDFYRNLQMQATVAPFDAFHLPRIAQLISKTNQFNLTTRRHGIPALQAFMQNPDCVHFFLRLCDRFSDHGLVSLMIALRHGVWLDIDTWLMSCRVVGRTVEATMLEHLCRWAQELDCKGLRGTYIPTAKNTMVKDLFSTFGFDLLAERGDAWVWGYDLHRKGPITNQFIQTPESQEAKDEPT
jgi:FkbH-like protein